MRVDVEGPPATVGHQLSWRQGDNRAVLRLSRVGDDGVEYDFLTALGGNELTVHGHGELRVSAAAEGCLVVWRDSSLVEGFTQRWFAWFGAQQESQRQHQVASLAGLRAALESR